MSRYVVISSDCHAGLPNAQYRDWLDPKHHQAFDDEQAARVVLEQELKARGMRNEEFAEEWERENEEGLRGGWDAARRDKDSTERARCRKYPRLIAAQTAIAASNPAASARHVTDNPSTHLPHTAVAIS